MIKLSEGKDIQERYADALKRAVDNTYGSNTDEPIAWVDEIWIKRPDLARDIGIEKMFMRSAEGVRHYIPLYATPQDQADKLKKYELRHAEQRERIAYLESQLYGGNTK
jgi:hypothetical protein